MASDIGQMGSTPHRFNRNPPPKKVGLDWEAIRADRARRLQEQVDRGVDNEETRLFLMGPDAEYRAALMKHTGQGSTPKKTEGPKKADQSAGGKKKGARWDLDKAVELYTEQDMPPKQIAQELGVTYQTVLAGLKRRDVFDPTRHRFKNPGMLRPKQTYSRQKYCSRCGTDLDVPGNSRERFKDGKPRGRECVPCKQQRDRERKKK